ncbi:hypothetical protein F2Q69_00007762 [Brassica cretica]|uniref:Uncharacterized protein n=1 Tax=Brassica cretica TaxID=69181 RepID=A0A8S9P6I4_BRACR|nr:hypothetical protein F2Q69_00007762 [Brassica cretica]
MQVNVCLFGFRVFRFFSTVIAPEEVCQACPIALYGSWVKRVGETEAAISRFPFSNDGIAGSGLLFVLPALTVASRFLGAFLSGGSTTGRSVRSCLLLGPSLLR